MTSVGPSDIVMRVFSFDNPIEYVEKIDIPTTLRQRVRPTSYVVIEAGRVRWPYGIIEEAVPIATPNDTFNTHNGLVGSDSVKEEKLRTMTLLGMGRKVYWQSTLMG
jgi:hypothetical protein